jgi:UPF0755 protein
MPGFATILKTGFAFFGLGLVLLGGALGMAAFEFWLFLKSPGSSCLGVQQVRITAGMKAAKVASLLSGQGIIADESSFLILCWLRKADQSLKAGDYALLPLSTPNQVLDQIVAGKAVIERVTFPEGATMYELAKVFQERGLASEKEVLRLVEDSDFVKANGLQAASLEGFLFPETYFFQRSQSEAAMLRMMIRQFWRHLPEGWEQRAAELGVTLKEVVIMASMVEKEAAVDSERPTIAGVFYNRLKRKMPLQSDPTAVYDLAGFSGPITSTQLKRRSPYNTYLNRGLPIGPICNPGAKSLQAALFPENVPYLYFVSKRDGTHQFSETLAEHQQAVALWQQKRKDANPPAGEARRVTTTQEAPGAPVE